jgi:serine/threonine protein phosphatase PrpC
MGLKIDFAADKSLCSDVGLVRKANEDNCGYAQTPNGYLFVVCDGMGGHVGGATASNIGVNSIIEYLSKEAYSNIKQALHDALVFANIQILGTARENPGLKGMGTTACILLVAGDEAWIAHVGDSRIYLYIDREKFLHRITKDHSFVQSLVDRGEIRDEDVENHPKKNIILKALGIKEDIQPTVCESPVLPAKNDIFLICSDGLSGMINDTVIEATLKKVAPLNDKVNELIYLALQNGGKDNVTAQLIQVVDSPWKTAEPNGNEYTPAWRIAQMGKPVNILKKKNLWVKIAAAAIIVLIPFVWFVLDIRSCNTKISELEQKIENAQERIGILDTDTVCLNKNINSVKKSIDSLSRLTKKGSTPEQEIKKELKEELEKELSHRQEKLDKDTTERNNLKEDSIPKWKDEIKTIKAKWPLYYSRDTEKNNSKNK